MYTVQGKDHLTFKSTAFAVTQSPAGCIPFGRCKTSSAYFGLLIIPITEGIVRLLRSVCEKDGSKSCLRIWMQFY